MEVGRDGRSPRALQPASLASQLVLDSVREPVWIYIDGSAGKDTVKPEVHSWVRYSRRKLTREESSLLHLF